MVARIISRFDIYMTLKKPRLVEILWGQQIKLNHAQRIVPSTEGPRLTRISGLEKNMLCKICVSGTVEGPLLMEKSSTCAYMSQHWGSVTNGCENRVSDTIHLCVL